MVHCRGGGHRYGQDAGGGVVSVQTLQGNVFTDPDRNGSDADEGNEVGNVERRLVCRGLAIAGRDRVAAVFQDPALLVDSPTWNRWCPSADHSHDHGFAVSLGEAGAGSQVLAQFLVLGTMGGAALGGWWDFRALVVSRPQRCDSASRLSRDLPLDAGHRAGDRTRKKAESK